MNHVRDDSAGLGDGSLLAIDDDRPCRNRLARALHRRGFTLTTAAGVAAGKLATAHLAAHSRQAVA